MDFIVFVDELSDDQVEEDVADQNIDNNDQLSHEYCVLPRRK